MSIVEIFIIAVGLSMDAFAVAVCKGLSVRKLELKHIFIVGLYFGIFQGTMPLIGFFLGKQLENFITSVDHWIAFALLSFIGGNTIREAIKKDNDAVEASFGFKAMLPLAVATSIDAFAVGITFAFLQVNIFLSVIFIGSVTFVLSAIGVKIGNAFGAKFKSKAEIIGGVILILMGLKILLEHLGIINF